MTFLPSHSGDYDPYCQQTEEYCGSIPRGKARSGRDANHLHPPNAEVKNEDISSPLGACMEAARQLYFSQHNSQFLSCFSVNMQKKVTLKVLTVVTVARNRTKLWWRQCCGLAESAFSGSLEWGGRFCIGVFGRNLDSVAVKKFSRVIYFTNFTLDILVYSQCYS
jgi:hypothetical protein